MYVHIDPEFLNRHPWVAVAIGAAGVVLMTFVLHGFWGEYEKFRRAGKPRKVTIESVAVADGETVTLRAARWPRDRSQVSSPLLVLHAKAGPEEAERSLVLALAFFVGFSAFAAYYLRKWGVRQAARAGERRE